MLNIYTYLGIPICGLWELGNLPITQMKRTTKPGLYASKNIVEAP
jgi:hypothetical protein